MTRITAPRTTALALASLLGGFALISLAAAPGAHAAPTPSSATPTTAAQAKLTSKSGLGLSVNLLGLSVQTSVPVDLPIISTGPLDVSVGSPTADPANPKPPAATASKAPVPAPRVGIATSAPAAHRVGTEPKVQAAIRPVLTPHTATSASPRPVAHQTAKPATRPKATHHQASIVEQAGAVFGNLLPAGMAGILGACTLAGAVGLFAGIMRLGGRRTSAAQVIAPR